VLPRQIADEPWTAEQLSNELHAAQNRIAELEAELQLNRERADRAEEWLNKISMEIEDRFINQPVEKRREVFWRP
jgi:predicted  nucleic acid-binding Zn-ribbon protein